MQTCCKAMSHFVFCVIYPIFPRNIIDVSHLHYFLLFMLQVQSDLKIFCSSGIPGGQKASPNNRLCSNE